MEAVINGGLTGRSMELDKTCPHGQVLVLTAFGHGHLFPCLELCRRIACQNYKATLIVFSHLVPSINSSFTQNPLIDVVQVPSPSPRPGLPAQLQQDTYDKLNRVVEGVLSEPHLVRPVCAVVNMFMLMSWTKGVFNKFHVPTVGFFTSGACSPAMEHASWKADAEDIRSGEFRPLPGLPDSMGLTRLNIKRRPFRSPTSSNGPGKPPGPGMPQNLGPPGPGKRPVWLDDVEDPIGFMFNTFDDLERPFLKYLTCQLEKPAWGVGPLLPDEYWKVEDSPVHDEDVRINRNSSMTEANIMDWMDMKPRGSVIFISFGSSLSPTVEELAELAEALAELAWPFIWVIQSGTGADYFPHGLDGRVGKRGLIITGWAPQLLILSHPSTGGFLSHCGWNSTIESLMQGVPLLACPIRGDQYDNARLVVDHFKVGIMVTEDPSSFAKKDNFAKAIERLMENEEIKERAKELRSCFGCKFPSSSDAALDDFKDLIQ
ncbi:scopoletin glucosyltransferase-like [Punica granatum]|uniref:Glycosyltransferase n=2 Tax=Punica granatum TaxID=22663 RepID=A0A218W6P0_PUNGR|nr:scopoletin glucosyltransferase-like [Punica granatum]OWM68534.1 hypothetical protein CDL15_Pgr023499 [Punica granatum]PKI46215.1 hypothetical protein CRG98_033387 [Punica granatum]